ncbi:MAG: hypothetical protein KatS3mg039_1579 [Candidatus Kapaibacterium sp.]|nr:MAG: hypothetical protein KatS3mg039_1579 [Candidatus Kapabacteria bacterium]
MARFRFRLQTLLHYRQHLVEQSEQAVARLSAEEQALLEQIHHCRAELNSRADHGAGMKAHQLQLQDAYRQQLADRVRLLERQLDAVRSERQREQERLVERMQACDVLERLRERRLQEHAYTERRDEQNQLDDIATRQRRARSSANGL